MVMIPKLLSIYHDIHYINERKMLFTSYSQEGKAGKNYYNIRNFHIEHQSKNYNILMIYIHNIVLSK